MRLERLGIIARAFEIGHVFARPVLEVREPERGFVVEAGNLRHKLHFGIRMRTQPADRPVASHARDHFEVMSRIAVNTAYHRWDFLPTFGDDGIDQLAAARTISNGIVEEA